MNFAYLRIFQYSFFILSISNSSSPSKGLWAWDLVKVILGLTSLVFAGILIAGGFTEESTRFLIRLTAKLSFSLFCLAFAASGIHLFFRHSGTFWLLMNRKYLGITFAIIHWVHLFFLGLLQYFFHPVFNLAKKTSLLGGGFAYLFLSLMLVTSFPRFSKYLSHQQWKLLHSIGGYWILFIFSTSYVRRFMTEWKWWPFLLAIGLVLGFRGWAWWAKRNTV